MRRLPVTVLFLALLVVLCPASNLGCRVDPGGESAAAGQLPVLTPQVSGTDVLFIGISPVDDQTVWLSGTEGTYARTTDGGISWITAKVAGADSLQFRDVHAVDEKTAYLLSIGKGQQSRIYKTTDGGESWTAQFINTDPDGFYDCMDFWDEDHGLAFSDSVNDTFLIISTENGGQHWEPIASSLLPPALDGEGGFAASGTCLTTQGEGTAWIGTGAGGKARVLKTTDRGKTWSVSETPIVHGTPTSGVLSLAFLDEKNGIAAGGEITASDTLANRIALSADGGSTWTLGGSPTFAGAVYSIAYVTGMPEATLLASGPGGLDMSTDDGQTWSPLDTLNYWSVAFSESRIGWAAGTEGKILKIEFR